MPLKLNLLENPDFRFLSHHDANHQIIFWSAAQIGNPGWADTWVWRADRDYA